jgi:hypothetical protein
MKTILLFSMLAAAVSANADVVLTLDPGTLKGAPGQTVGWGFTLTSDPFFWISAVTSSPILESNPGLGQYNDLVGALGGPDGALGPARPDWTLSFEAGNQTGFAEFSIDPDAVPGTVDSGLLDLNYELFSDNPFRCSDCAVGFADLQVPFQIEVVAPAASAPEPDAAWLAAAGTIALWLRRRR